MSFKTDESASTSIASRRRAVCAKVREVTAVCAEHTRLVLGVNDFPSSLPGQFVQVICTDAQQAGKTCLWEEGRFPEIKNEEAHKRQAFLCRPFSIGDRFVDDDGVDCITLISRNIGPGTAWLERLSVGDNVQIMGPMGVPFRFPRDSRQLVLVGGGVGIPPLLYLCRAMQAAKLPDGIVFFGVRNQSLLPVELTQPPAIDGKALPCLKLPGKAAYPAVIASDDGSIGVRGTVIDAMNAWQARTGKTTDTIQVSACGPDVMLRAVANQARNWNATCQLCIERTMGCGSGTCLSCIVRVHDVGADGGQRWALSCSEGPVFDRETLVDY